MRAALVVVAILVGLQLLWSARFLVLTAFLGILFGLAAAQPVDLLEAKYRIRRSVGAPLIVFGVVALLVLVAVWTGPTLLDQSQELKVKLPEAVTKFEAFLAKTQPKLLNVIAPPDSTTIPGIQPGADPTRQRGRLMGALGNQASTIGNLAFGILQSTLAVVGAIILVIFLAVYIAADPGVYKRGVLALVPERRRDRVSDLMTVIAATLRKWFATQLIAMLVIGTITTIALLILDVRAALPLGVIAGLFEFIPNIGPTLSALPAILMGFVDSPQKALIIVGLYWALQFLENNLLIPYLMKEQLDLPPALTLVTQVIMAYVFGFLGLFVAIPLLATVVAAVRTLWVDDEAPEFEFDLPSGVGEASIGTLSVPSSPPSS